MRPGIAGLSGFEKNFPLAVGSLERRLDSLPEIRTMCDLSFLRF